jgi:hypothetical protein
MSTSRFRQQTGVVVLNQGEDVPSAVVSKRTHAWNIGCLQTPGKHQLHHAARRTDRQGMRLDIEMTGIPFRTV